MDTRNARTANERISETREETEYVYVEPDALDIPISKPF